MKNADLIEHFKAVFPEEPQKKKAVRELFKMYVDNIAIVKADCDVKYVCLKKKFSSFAKEPHSSAALIYSQRAGAHSRQVSDAQLDPGAVATCQQQTSSNVRVQHDFKGDHRSKCREKVDNYSLEMRNTESLWSEKKVSKKEQSGKVPDIPEILMIEASPLSVQGSVFTMPGPVGTGSTRQVDATLTGLSPTFKQVETQGDQNYVALSRQTCKVCRGGFLSRQPESENTEDDTQFDACSLKCSRLLHYSVSLSGSDNDSASLVSSSLDDYRALVTLDPLEHEWMICASDGKWGSLYSLLTTEPSLVLRKDFVTGFTCLHWAAKHGNPELIALILNFSKTHNIPVSVDVRSNTGYTPLHIAAMHNHMEVVKLLVGAYNADVEIRDYSGRKACQYLTDNVSVGIRDIIGAYEQAHSENTDHKNGGRWRFSRVLQSNLKPIRLLSLNDYDAVDMEDQPREKPHMRKSSLSKVKPKLQKLRMRTSQIVHSMSFRDTEELNESIKGSFKS